jgi:hypothetical protein
LAKKKSFRKTGAFLSQKMLKAAFLQQNIEASFVLYAVIGFL